MTRLRFALMLAILAQSGVGCLADEAAAVVPRKPVVVHERGLELPFQIKTEAEMKFRDQVSPGLGPAPHERLRPSFFGLSVSHPFETGK